jgi:hypothetical protein
VTTSDAVRLAKRTRLNGGSLTLANPHDLVRRVLQLTQAGDVETITVEVWFCGSVDRVADHSIRSAARGASYAP